MFWLFWSIIIKYDFLWNRWWVWIYFSQNIRKIFIFYCIFKETGKIKEEFPVQCVKIQLDQFSSSFNSSKHFNRLILFCLYLVFEIKSNAHFFVVIFVADSKIKNTETNLILIRRNYRNRLGKNLKKTISLF